ncbi:M15 family metallopeptidase [Streptomyces sp. SID14478]|uniref:M15 family metallopeptidase n=1 Tax=Streptomyces sp. SID14478 TaxID=2706073 RepID=UPI0013DFEDC1|nr:M15 family metallopeptidase [Streptomyces sp. SID14478]NEB81362.1 M15 family metallopeptidase [Streptomyces sp. SID14478]
MIRTRRLTVVCLVVVAAALVAALVHRLPKASSSSSSPPPSAAAPSPPRGAAPHASRSGHRGPPDADDGVVPDGVTVFDDATAAVTKLDPGLLTALRRAATAAADDRVTFFVNSGWRSPAYQNQLLREAVAEYGSEDEAARWVATAVTSPHVAGDAVDIGRTAAADWLARHGAAYGLCRIYDNEPWHYELRGDARDHGCPQRYADPTEDPRMRR